MQQCEFAMAPEQPEAKRRKRITKKDTDAASTLLALATYQETRLEDRALRTCYDADKMEIAHLESRLAGAKGETLQMMKALNEARLEWAKLEQKGTQI